MNIAPGFREFDGRYTDRADVSPAGELGDFSNESVCWVTCQRPVIQTPIASFDTTLQMKLRPIARDIAVFAGFFVLTCAMTWPWILNVRDAVSDRGDPYLHTYFMWWDYHQTLRSPTNLFDATIFYPYRDTLAFSENDYGAALPFFPLYALGIDPLTVFSLATLVAFAFSGFGMFRLARTLTGSEAAAWIAGIVFAFVPYHFQRLPHLPLIFAGWIPLMLEAAVLFGRQRSWRRAAWLGFAFLMNALTCVVWFTLTLIPFAISLLVLWLSDRKDLKGWLRGAIALTVSFLLTCVFLYPYYRVHQVFGFVRNPLDALLLSAHPINWLAVSERSKLWRGMGGAAATDELSLFPGLLPPLLMLAAFLLISPIADARRRGVLRWKPPRVLVVIMDVATFVGLIVSMLAAGQILKSVSPARALLIAIVILAIRSVLVTPESVRWIGRREIFADLRAEKRTLPIALALVWLLTGFFGSLGMNFPFHRFLWQIILPFRSIRAPARWAMICYVGLAILAAFGTIQFGKLVKRWLPQVPTKAVFGALMLLMLFEQRVAPLQFTHGERPNELIYRLKNTRMAGGLVELPAETNGYDYQGYVYRAIYHQKPIITASSSFSPPFAVEIEALTHARPIPDHLMDLFEGVPASYLVVHYSLMSQIARPPIDGFLARQLAAGRIRFINSYGDPTAPDDLYAITKIEPAARSEITRSPSFAYAFVRQQYLDVLNREPTKDELERFAKPINNCGTDVKCITEYRMQVASTLVDSSEFRGAAGLLYRAFQLAFRRPSTLSEWQRAREKLSAGKDAHSVIQEWLQQPEVVATYPESLGSAEYVNRLAQNSPLDSANRNQLIEGLNEAKLTRVDVLVQIAKATVDVRDDDAFVRMFYLIFLNRDADSQGLTYWVEIRRKANDDKAVLQGFLNSAEYSDRVGLAAGILRGPQNQPAQTQ